MSAAVLYYRKRSAPLMAWEARRGGRRYLYKSIREGNRVRKVYLGAGPTAELAALWDAREAEECSEARYAEDVERKPLQELDGRVGEYCRDVEQLVRAALTAAG